MCRTNSERMRSTLALIAPWPAALKPNQDSVERPVEVMVAKRPAVQFAAESTTRVELAALMNGGLSSETRCAYLSNATTPASNDLKGAK